jgi:hypothetical protein
MLVEFTYAHLHSCILSGYRFLQYESRYNHGVITALNTETPSTSFSKSTSYIIPITDEQGLQMASGSVDLLEDFTFYLSLEDYV